MEYITHIIILVSIYSILAISLNLVVGFTGLLSITHAAFFGIGAYTTAILTTSLGLNFFTSLIVSIILSFFVSIIIGFVLSRFKGDYYVLVTFGFNTIIWSIFINWQSITRGPLGIPGISRPSIFGLKLDENLYFLFFVIGVTFLIYKIAKFISNSSFGRALKGIREDEQALQIFGYNTQTYKLNIFAISASLASIAGSLFASYITFIDPSTFTLTESIYILSIVVLGGIASLEGSIYGAIFLVILPEALRFVGFSPDTAAQTRIAIYGLLLILLMLYRPKGFKGEYKI